MTAWIIVLYFAGLLLFMAEFVIPGMITGIIGSVMIISSLVLAVKHIPDYALLIVILQLVGVLFAVIGGMYLLPRSRLSRRLILSDSQQADAGWVSADTETHLIGSEGTVHTALRPAGSILVGGKRYDAVADGSFIDKGRRIRVIEVHGSRVVVEAADEAETQ
jgi:membrane-bound serine protease (ClpP class)